MSVFGMGSLEKLVVEMWRLDESHALAAPALPGDLADVLHLLEPISDERWGGWKWLPLAAILGVWWWRQQRRVAPKPRPVTPIEVPKRLPLGSELADKIERLRQQVLLTRRYREGCHRLAALLRQRGEEAESQPMTVWTQGEITAYLGDIPLSRAMALLAELQFGRRAPGRDDFEGACELAAEASQGRRW